MQKKKNSYAVIIGGYYLLSIAYGTKIVLPDVRLKKIAVKKISVKKIAKLHTTKDQIFLTLFN